MASRCRIRVLVALNALLTAGGIASAQNAPRDDQALVEFFEKKVRPVLANNCFNCHSANTNTRGGLRLDDRNGMIAGGGSGPAVVPGHPEKSFADPGDSLHGRVKTSKCRQRSGFRPRRWPT